MHLGQVSGRRRAVFRSYLCLAPRVAAEVVKMCCGSQRWDPSMILGWTVHRGLRSHLLVAPVSSGQCGGLCSGGLLMTALLFLFLCWDRSQQRDPMDERGLKEGDWLMCRLSWCSIHPVSTGVCWGYGCLWPSGSWDAGMAITGASSWARVSDGQVTKSVVVHGLSWEGRPRKTCGFFSFWGENVAECNWFQGICLLISGTGDVWSLVPHSPPWNHSLFILPIGSQQKG